MTAVEIQQSEKTLILTINRPEALNALNTEVREGLLSGLFEAGNNSEIRVVVITGAGERAFCAGADLKEMAQRNSTNSNRNTFWGSGTPSLQRGLEFWKPVIAAVNGVALGGGCELAMSCDIRIAATHAKFGQPEVTRGIIPGAGGTQRLPRLISFGIVLEMLMTGTPISAQEAYRVGLVNHITENKDLIDKALEIASTISKNAPLAVMAAKEAAYRGMNATLQEGLRIENFESALIRNTNDSKEGPRAFSERREPQYNGD